MRPGRFPRWRTFERLGPTAGSDSICYCLGVSPSTREGNRKERRRERKNIARSLAEKKLPESFFRGPFGLQEELNSSKVRKQIKVQGEIRPVAL